MLKIYEMSDINDLETLGTFFICDEYEDDDLTLFGFEIPFLENIIGNYNPIIVDEELFFNSREECDKIIKEIKSLKEMI